MTIVFIVPRATNRGRILGTRRDRVCVCVGFRSDFRARVRTVEGKSEESVIGAARIKRGGAEAVAGSGKQFREITLVSNVRVNLSTTCYRTELTWRLFLNRTSSERVIVYKHGATRIFCKYIHILVLPNSRST